MLEALKETVCEANLELSRRGVVLYTRGNVSGIDRARGRGVIKPSGVPDQGMQPSDMVVVDLEGRIVEGTLRPSSDTPTHLELYKAFPEIGSVVHTHSTHAVVFAQAGMEIPPLGTTHADYFYGAVPVSRSLTRDEVQEAYEKNTGRVIVDTVKETEREPLAVPGVLVRNHGPFTWGKDPAEAVYHSVVLEKIAEMAWKTLQLNPAAALPPYILEKHYQRKHGPKAYYGQK